MIPNLLYITLLILRNIEISFSFVVYNMEDTTIRQYNDEISRVYATLDNPEFEPVISQTHKDREKSGVMKNLNCDGYTQYALNCTMHAAIIYNTNYSHSPPMPAMLNQWCRSIRHLTNCAIDWNEECEGVSDSLYKPEDIKGHMHVVENICDDEGFLTQYDALTICIESVGDSWFTCYSDFKDIVVKKKNGSKEWTHFAVHFELCCARARFRRCIFDVLFGPDGRCERGQALTLQRFSVVVSEGDVLQDCDKNTMYENCPGGDPRPRSELVEQLMNADEQGLSPSRGGKGDGAGGVCWRCPHWLAALVIILF